MRVSAEHQDVTYNTIIFTALGCVISHHVELYHTDSRGELDTAAPKSQFSNLQQKQSK